MDSLIGFVVCLGLLICGALPLGLLIVVLNLSSTNKRLGARVDLLEEQLRLLERRIAERPVGSWVAQTGPAAVPAATRSPSAKPAVPAAPTVPETTKSGELPVSEAALSAEAPPSATAGSVSAAPSLPNGTTAEGPAPSLPNGTTAEGPAPSVPGGTTAEGPASPVPGGTTAEGPATPGGPTRPVSGAPPAVPRAPSDFSPERLALWVLAAAGGGLFLLAALFGFREAANAGWVGPGVRFATGILVGVGAWGLGELLRSRRYVVPAGALVGAGAAVLYGALYAGASRYGLLSQPVAFGSMIAVTTVTMLAAVAHRSRFQASLGTIGGFLTPVLLSTGQNAALAFLSYLCLLNLGILVAARRREWWDQVLLAGFITPLLYLGWALTWRAPDQVSVGLGGAFALTVVFLGAAVVGKPAKGVAVSSWVSGLGMALAGAVLVWPADPLRVDPVSSRTLEWSLGATAWFAAAYVLGMVVLLALVPRRMPGDTKIQALHGWVGAAVSAVLLLLHVGGWLGAGEPRWEPVMLVLLSAPLMGQVLAVAEGWGGPMLLAASTVAGIGGISVLDGPAAPELGRVLVLAVGLGLPPAVLFRVRGPVPALPLGAVVGGLILLALRNEVTEAPGLSLLTALFLYSIWFFPPFLMPKRGNTAAVMAAALVGVVMFQPLRLLWEESLGAGVLGALPMLLGATLLLGTVVSLRTRTLDVNSREIAILAGLVMLAAAVAVPLQLDRAWLTVGWALEIAALSLLYRRIQHPLFWIFAGILGGLVVVRLLFNPAAYSYGGGEGLILLNWTLYTWGLPAVALLVAATFFDRPPKPVPVLPVIFQLTAILFLFVLVNLEVSHAFAHDGQLSFTGEGLAQEMTRSISWAGFGLALILAGSIWESRWTRLVGLLFALLGVAKACLWDLWQLSGFYRVGSLAGMAIALLLAAIAFQRLVLRDRRKP